jgi:hypothetical protein
MRAAIQLVARSPIGYVNEVRLVKAPNSRPHRDRLIVGVRNYHHRVRHGFRSTLSRGRASE